MQSDDELRDGKPYTVPLVMYIDGKRRVVGESVIKGEIAESFLYDTRDGEMAKRAIQPALNAISFEFNPPKPEPPHAISEISSFEMNYGPYEGVPLFTFRWDKRDNE
jgi:hypothetical protein